MWLAQAPRALCPSVAFPCLVHTSEQSQDQDFRPAGLGRGLEPELKAHPPCGKAPSSGPSAPAQRSACPGQQQAPP